MVGMVDALPDAIETDPFLGVEKSAYPSILPMSFWDQVGFSNPVVFASMNLERIK